MDIRPLARKVKADVEFFAERGLPLASKFTSERGPRRGHVLIAGPGQGSVGDEAMYQAFIASCPGSVTVVGRDAADFRWTDASGRVTYVFLADLLYGSVRGRRRDLARLLPLAARSESVSIIGADVMDGVYSEVSSVRRFRTAGLAARVGVPSQVLGFSWNSHPTRRARNAMRAVGDEVTLLARDDFSAQRLRQDGASRVEAAADLAFLTRADEPIEDQRLVQWLQDQRTAGRPLVVVNANPRLEKAFPDQRGQYLRLMRTLVSDGVSCVLLPHDSRGGDASEETYLRTIRDEFGPSEHIHLVERAPMPAQMVAITREAELVVSGRMHLVVLTSVAGRSAVALDYQDKFEGLFRILGYDGRIAATGEWDLVDRVRVGLREAPAAERALATSWEEILRRARLNLPASARSE